MEFPDIVNMSNVNSLDWDLLVSMVQLYYVFKSKFIIRKKPWKSSDVFIILKGDLWRKAAALGALYRLTLF